MSPPALASFVVCPETLGPLEAVDGGFWSPQAERLYPYEQGIVFMGYPAEDQTMIDATMREERDQQALNAEAAATNLAYLKASAPRAVDFLNTVTPFVQRKERRLRALELGSGNGWVSWLIAEAGFETWMCDFEPNTLATGMNLKHPNLGEGRRFATDARYPPFESGAFDLVVFKEFVHHVADFKPLFREANRVLCSGGTMAMMEPVRSVWRSVRELRHHPDPHGRHHITWVDSYLRAIRASGMEVVYQTPVYSAHGNTRWPAAWMKQRALAAIDEDHPTGNLLSKLQLRLFGGAQMLIVARKVRELPPRKRPPMQVIDPATLVAGDPDPAYREFPSVLREAAGRLQRLPTG